MRVCTKCKNEKEADKFLRGKSYCRECRETELAEEKRIRARKWNAENKERKAERARERRLENLAEYRAKGRAYAAADKEGAKRRMRKWLADPANRERKRLKNKEWRERNRERKAALDKKWAENNPERRRAIHKRYRERNPDAVRMRMYVDHARARGAPLPDPETRDYIRILESDPCCYCGESMQHIDHIESVVRGGDSEWSNLTSSCRSCNQRKNARSLLAHLMLSKR